MANEENGSPSRQIMLELMKAYTAHGITCHDFYSGKYRGLQWFQLKPPLKVSDDRAKAMISVLIGLRIMLLAEVAWEITQRGGDDFLGFQLKPG